ncbi:MAG TPA: hypothetical protein GX733_00380 [Tissierellia bacterium]|nr:hypothetical protein [Tissierellia bacterium]
MKALIYKDMILSKREYIATLFIYFIFAVFSIGDRGTTQIPLTLFFIIILNSYRTAIWMMLDDLKSGFVSFALSGVNSRSEYVLSKYALIWIEAALAAVYALVMSLYLRLPADVSLLFILLSASIPLLSAALILPIAFFEGEHIRSIIQMVGVSTLLILLLNFRQWVPQLQEIFQSANGSPWKPSILWVTGVIALHAVAIWVSLRAFQQREF